MSHTTETIIMSVGGSLIVPDQIDTTFLAALKDLLATETANGRSFIVITGGGKTSRRYVAAAATFNHITTEQKDEIGIAACQMNAALLKPIFADTPAVQINPDLDLYQPGASSDRAATRTALRHGAQKIINLSNISHVYTADPNVDPAAEKIEDVTWTEFRKLIPAEFTPNLSSPFDPEAAKEAEEHNLEVATISGQDLEALQNYLAGETFTGTLIHP